MSFYQKMGSLAWVAEKLDGVVDAAEIMQTAVDPATRDQAAFDAATKLAEAVGIGIPLYFLDEALTKTGLDRVFDSLKKDKAFEQYLKDQIASKNLRDYGLGTIAEWGLDELRKWISENRLLDPVFDATNDLYLLARNFIRRDPLAIDLDGDGIETVGVDAGVLFDHDADAIKTGTGWLKADDAFVVLDRDGNGTIDSGRELFGVDTVVGTEPLTGRAIYAVDAFDALKSIDSNGDNLFNSADVQYGNLRLWRDLNQDGISQTTELQGLAEAAITGINLTTQKATKTLPGGNTQILTAAVAGLGESAAIALELAHNPFYRQFPDHLDTTSVASLPDMAGSGMVRDLQEAATLSTSLASQLAALQNGYRDRQQFDTELDTLLDTWAATSTLKTSAQNAVLYKTSVQTTKVSRGGTPANGTWKHAA